MKRRSRRATLALWAALGGVALTPLPAAAGDPGITDREILIGQTMAYSGPPSAYGAFGRTEAAYFQMINERGGIRSRKLRLISLDDGGAPPRTVEQTRKLVEQENVFLVFASLGSAGNVVVRKYLNQHRVPQLFATSGIATFGDYRQYPWTIGWQPTYEIEGQIFIQYLRNERPTARIGILYQNDDLGKDYVRGIRRELGDKAATAIVSQQSYEFTDPTVDSQIVALQASGADTFINISTPKFAAQAIRKADAIGWRPLHLMSYAAASVSATMVPAGVERSVGIISSTYFKDPTDPQWANDPDFIAWSTFMDKYLPGVEKTDIYYVVGYMMANSLVQLLEQCGEEMTRENVMRQVANIDFRVPMLLPGVRLQTGPTDFYPIKSLQLERFDGKSFLLFGKPMNGVPNPQ